MAVLQQTARTVEVGERGLQHLGALRQADGQDGKLVLRQYEWDRIAAPAGSVRNAEQGRRAFFGAGTVQLGPAVAQRRHTQAEQRAQHAAPVATQPAGLIEQLVGALCQHGRRPGNPFPPKKEWVTG